MAIDGGDLVLALLERQAGELGSDILGALEFLALKSEHRRILVEVRKAGPIGVECGVVVLHKRLRHRVWIHRRHHKFLLFYPCGGGVVAWLAWPRRKGLFKICS